MAAITGQSEPDGLSQQHRDIVHDKLAGINPGKAYPEMHAFVYMIVFGGLMLAAIVCCWQVASPVVMSLVGGAS